MIWEDMSLAPVPNYSKSAINKAGKVLLDPTSTPEQRKEARKVLDEWRVCHAYPMNTFQATLRKKLKGFRTPLIAQRLKRLPTIIDKMNRHPEMDLVRMQDIGGLRAVVMSIKDVRRLADVYRDQSRFKHELLKTYDYIDRPKEDGYRGIHLVYRYKNNQTETSAKYNGLLIELQLRTQKQHIWATAVETMGTFRGEALKSRQGDKKWLEFFAVTASAFAYLEKTNLVPGYKRLSRTATFAKVAQLEAEIKVLETVSGLSVAGNFIQKNGQDKGWYYHLIILNSETHSVTVRSYPKSQLGRASADYAAAEEEAIGGAQIEPVLVAAGTIDLLRKAYPNYFLDIRSFIEQVERIIRMHEQEGQTSS